MGFDYRSKLLLRKLHVTRVFFGLACSALTMVFWLRTGMPQLWPKLVRVDAIPNTVVTVSESESMVNFSGLKSVKNTSSLHSVVHVSQLDSDFACSSRLQQYRYRKQEYEFPLSESLTAALAEYTRMYSLCRSGEHDAKPGCKYLVYYEGWEGLGNRLLSVVTAFTYALVTNRALVTVANRGHLGALLCEPFPNSTWILPSPVANAVLAQAVSLDDAVASQFVNVTAVHVNLRHSQSAGVRAFFCSEAQQGLRDVPWVIWESNQYYIPRLFMLSDFWTTLNTWFPDVSRVFTQLGRVLCVPKDEVWRTIRELQDAEMVQVGIQVRRHGVRDDAGFSETVYDRIVKCVEDVVPPRRGTRASVLVTSLQSVYWEKMRERWKGGPEVKFVMVSHEGTEQYSYEQARKAMVEIWLLSFCNTALATSGWSTFGYVAQALAGMRPRILNIRGGEYVETEPACSPGQSPEPCLHYPFMSATTSSSFSNNTEIPLSNNTEILPLSYPNHEMWVARHILSCQDELNGLQLVSL